MSMQALGRSFSLAQQDFGGVTVLETIAAGGAIGAFIILLSIGALALVVRHLLQIRLSSLAPDEVVGGLRERLDRADADAALSFCDDPDNGCFLTRTLGAALRRVRRSPLGTLELRAALEEAGQQEAARLYRSTDGLGLIAGVAPMLGLLGTVVGMVGAFDTISASEGFARPDQLAGDISQALVTTLMGLTLAIPAMAAFTYFRNRIDALSGRVAILVEDLTEGLDQSDLGAAQESAQGASSTPRSAAG